MAWIPYNHEDKDANPLPKGYAIVWIYDEYYSGVTLGYWDGYWRHHSGSDDIGVTHWMPLEYPEPPEGVE